MILPLISAKDDALIGDESLLVALYNQPQRISNGLILLCTAGTARITVNLLSCQATANSEIILLPNSILLISEATPDFRFLFFAYSSALFDEACLHLGPPFFGFLTENFHHLHTAEAALSVCNLIQQVRITAEEGEHLFRRTIIGNYLQIFFLNTYDKTYRYFTRQQQQGYNRQDTLFKRFIGLVKKYYTRQRDVSFYAGELCLSTKYLSQISQRITSYSAKKIIDDFVMLELKVLLQSTNLSVQEIADRMHFPDQSYLGRYFKRFAGISPGEYRKHFIPLIQA